MGKLGALTPTILFNYISDRAKFWVVCWAGLIGCVVTLVFVPDATGEQSQQFHRVQPIDGVCITSEQPAWNKQNNGQ